MTDLLNRPWSIAPLRHKYYGTVIIDSTGREMMKLWLTDTGDVPSARELGDESLEDFWEWCCDSHWESERSYQTCAMIVDLINDSV